MLCMHLPNLVFVALALWQPTGLPVVSAAIALEQFGYGFGFTAYLVYMLMVAGGSDGNSVHRAAHYALCTGFMALGMMVCRACGQDGCRTSLATSPSLVGPVWRRSPPSARQH